jgi:hypothetical protein
MHWKPQSPPGRILNSGSLEYVPGVLATRPWQWVWDNTLWTSARSSKSWTGQNTRSFYGRTYTWGKGIHSTNSPQGRAIYRIDLQPLACWDCGCESHCVHVCLLWCCVLLGTGLCVDLITRPQKSCERGVSECDSGASIMRRTWLTRGLLRHEKKTLPRRESWKLRAHLHLVSGLCMLAAMR